MTGWTRTILLGAALSLSPGALASTGEWRLLGPWGGPIRQIALNPRSESVVYASTAQAIFATEDGALTWSFVADADFPTIAVNPLNSDLVYTEGGSLFCRPASRPAVVIHYSTYGVQELHGVDAAGAVWVTLAQESLAKSGDFGQSWQPLTPPTSGRPEGFVFHPFDAKVVFSLGTLRATDDGGQTWRDAGSAIEGPVSSIAIAPRPPSTVYAGTSSGRVYRSADGGQSWSEAGRAGSERIARLRVDPDSVEHVWVAFDSGAVARSTDGGSTWQSFPAPNPPDSDSRSDLFVPEKGSACVSGSKGVLCRREGEETWRESSRGIAVAYPDSVAIAPSDSATFYVTSRAPYPDGTRRMHASSDRGETWATLSLPTPHRTVGPMTVDARDHRRIYVPSSGGAWSSEDGGASWVRLNDHTTWSYSHAVTADPVSPMIIYVIAEVSTGWWTSERRLYRSADRGSSWNVILDKPVLCGPIHVDPSSPSVLYVCGWMSADGGSRWTNIDGPILAIVPGSPSIVFSSRPSLSVATSGTNGWSAADAGLPPNAYVRRMAWDDSSRTLYADLGLGRVYVSYDRGATWTQQPLPSWDESRNGPFGELSAASRGTLYFSTTSGLYSVTPSSSGPRRRAVAR